MLGLAARPVLNRQPLKQDTTIPERIVVSVHGVAGAPEESMKAVQRIDTKGTKNFCKKEDVWKSKTNKMIYISNKYAAEKSK